MFILFCVQVVMATNRIETLDPALIRPGTVTPSAVETHISKMKLIMYFQLQNMSFMVVCDDSLFIVCLMTLSHRFGYNVLITFDYSWWRPAVSSQNVVIHTHLKILWDKRISYQCISSILPPPASVSPLPPSKWKWGGVGGANRKKIYGVTSKYYNDEEQELSCPSFVSHGWWGGVFSLGSPFKLYSYRNPRTIAGVIICGTAIIQETAIIRGFTVCATPN